MADSTKADLIASHIKEMMLNNIESLKDTAGRKIDFENLEKKHTDIKFTKQQYNEILKKTIKQLGKDPREFGLSVRLPVFKKPNSSIGGKTEPKQVAQTPYSKEQQSSKPADGQPQVTGQPQVAGHPTPATQEQMQELAQQIQFNFNAKNTGAMIKALYGGMKFVY